MEVPSIALRAARAAVTTRNSDAGGAGPRRYFRQKAGKRRYAAAIAGGRRRESFDLGPRRPSFE
jgi:hypothetical protein